MSKALLLTACFLFATPVVHAADLSGVWSGAFRVPDSEHDVPQLFTLKQNGNKLTGSGGPDSSEQYALLHGEVNGHRVEWEVKTSNRDFTYRLQEKDGELHGTLVIKGPEDTRTAEVWLNRPHTK